MKQQNLKSNSKKKLIIKANLNLVRVHEMGCGWTQIFTGAYCK